jgi:hypothetical protein
MFREEELSTPILQQGLLTPYRILGNNKRCQNQMLSLKRGATPQSIKRLWNWRWIGSANLPIEACDPA